MPDSTLPPSGRGTGSASSGAGVPTGGGPACGEWRYKDSLCGGPHWRGTRSGETKDWPIGELPGRLFEVLTIYHLAGAGGWYAVHCVAAAVEKIHGQRRRGREVILQLAGNARCCENLPDVVNRPYRWQRVADKPAALRRLSDPLPTRQETKT